MSLRAALRHSLIIGGLFLLLTSLRINVAPIHTDLNLDIPGQDAWVDFGLILEAGEPGDWDNYLWGGFTASAVKYGGAYYLYYQGASGYQTGANETVTGRAIGLAISLDGLNFTQVASNPVISWSPTGRVEEGAVSGSAVVDQEGVVLIYGANTAVNDMLVNADGRLARATDGIVFLDKGVVLDHGDTSLWGSGDELFPVLGFEDMGRWFVYYIPNGILQSGNLGVAWGPAPDRLTNSGAVLSGFSTVPAWGAVTAARVGPDTYALFISHVRGQYLEVRTVSLDQPDRVSAPLAQYRFTNLSLAAVLLDRDVNTWFMYYRLPENGGYGVRLAAAGGRDESPPSAVDKLFATGLEAGVQLTWTAAHDSDTGIATYRIYRGGDLVASTRALQYIAEDVMDYTDYAVSAVNFHNVEGPRSSPMNRPTS